LVGKVIVKVPAVIDCAAKVCTLIALLDFEALYIRAAENPVAVKVVQLTVEAEVGPVNAVVPVSAGVWNVTTDPPKV
jgi:hypothetical protein